MNSTLIAGKELARFDPLVLETIKQVPPRSPHPAEKRLRIGIQNEHGDIYRVIKIDGLYYFLDLIGKFRDLGFADELTEHGGEREGFDAILRLPSPYSQH